MSHPDTHLSQVTRLRETGRNSRPKQTSATVTKHFARGSAGPAVEWNGECVHWPARQATRAVHSTTKQAGSTKRRPLLRSQTSTRRFWACCGAGGQCTNMMVCVPSGMGCGAQTFIRCDPLKLWTSPTPCNCPCSLRCATCRFYFGPVSRRLLCPNQRRDTVMKRQVKYQNGQMMGPLQMQRCGDCSPRTTCRTSRWDRKHGAFSRSCSSQSGAKRASNCHKHLMCLVGAPSMDSQTPQHTQHTPVLLEI